MSAIAASPAFPRRHDVPSGAVPDYREFVRWVWSWKEEDGSVCIDGPPWMYTMIVHDPSEVMIASSVVGSLSQLPQFHESFEIIAMEDGSEFSFANLQALHAFLRSCATLGMGNDTARRVCEYTMWTLGFRWV